MCVWLNAEYKMILLMCLQKICISSPAGAGFHAPKLQLWGKSEASAMIFFNPDSKIWPMSKKLPAFFQPRLARLRDYAHLFHGGGGGVRWSLGFKSQNQTCHRPVRRTAALFWRSGSSLPRLLCSSSFAFCTVLVFCSARREGLQDEPLSQDLAVDFG